MNHKIKSRSFESHTVNPGSSMPWIPTVTAMVQSRPRERTSCDLSGYAECLEVQKASGDDARTELREDEGLVTGKV